MSTNTRPELSKRNKYYVEKHRYYELKHFCLQYDIWKRAYAALDGLSKNPAGLCLFESSDISDPTARCAISKARYSKYISAVDDAAKRTDEILCSYIIHGVTEGLSYEELLARYGIPCCREIYYDAYRRFFFYLSKIRD